MAIRYLIEDQTADRHAPEAPFYVRVDFDSKFRVDDRSGRAVALTDTRAEAERVADKMEEQYTDA